MGIQAKEPDAAHHAFMADQAALLSRYQSVPAIERVALMAQLVGQLIVEVPRGLFSAADVMQCVSANIGAGNENGAREMAQALKAVDGG